MRFLVGFVGLFVYLSSVSSAAAAPRQDETPWVVYEGTAGPGQGRHAVLIAGDEEYRSEEALPMLGRILAFHHGFRCTVLFSVDPETGEIDPDNQTHIPGLHHLETADLMVLFLRFRELPDEQMRYIVDYLESGKPVLGLRTSTHAFRYTRNPDSSYARYSFDSAVSGFEGGFGRRVLGETWINHHGVHGRESTRGLINGLLEDHPVLRGVRDIWGPSDVYGIRDIHGGGDVLVYGLSMDGMEPDSPPNLDKSVMPVAWLKTHTAESGREGRVFVTTLGASVDFESEDLRRLMVNAAYWAAGLEDRIPERAPVDYVGDYRPTFFGFGAYQRGLRPADFDWKPAVENPRERW
jgi:type 1 glutamine amidotransferase